MRAARARNILIAAFAISLLIHLLLAGYIRWPFLERQSSENEVINVRRITIARIVPHTPPPSPLPTPAATPRVRASIVPPPSTVHSSRGLPTIAAVGKTAPTPAPATPLPTAAPSAAASASGVCLHSNSDPAIASTPDPADIPPDVRAAKVSGTSAIQVSLDAKGRVTNATVAQSAGNAGLDSVAEQKARSATYTPKYVDCKAVAGTYTYTVKFVAW